ncbi:nose resistant to fluoxetine protein 6-like [Haemaphysalis longicornis]
MMQGRIASYGAYDQCLAVRHDQGLFQGKYCMVHLKHDGTELSPSLRVIVNKFVEHYGVQYVGNLTNLMAEGSPISVPLFKIGVCVPSLCQREDLQFIIDFFTKDIGSLLKVKWCTIEEPVKLDRRQTVILCIFVVWVSFILFGTAYDIYKTTWSTNDGKDSSEKAGTGYLSGVAASFSLRRAFKKLLDMPNWGDYSNELGFVHGMRVLSATWVILGHTHIIRDVHASSDGISFLKRIKEDFLFTVQMNSFMAVETFLVITGFLSGYLVMKRPPTKMSPILIVFVALFRRYIRLIMPMLAVMGSIYLLPTVVDGPMLKEHWSGFEEPCHKNWWKLFTMTHNYVDNFYDLCVPHFWYVAVDYQLAIVSTIILAVVLPKWPKASLWLMGIIAVATCLATGIQSYVIDAFPFSMIINVDFKRHSELQTEIYIKPYAHAATLFAAIIMGCLAARRHRLSRLFQGAAWTLATVVALAALLGVRTWTVGRLPERLESAFYAALHRVCWGLGVSWVMYACATGRGGYVTKILAWPIMYPLGRLSFAVYLVHIVLLGVDTVLGRELVSQQPFLHAQIYLSQAIMSYAIATTVYLLVECPVAGLDNMVFGKLKPKNESQSAKGKKDATYEASAVQSLHTAKDSTSIAILRTERQNTKDISGNLTKESCNGGLTNGYVNSVCDADRTVQSSVANGTLMSFKL